MYLWMFPVCMYMYMSVSIYMPYWEIGGGCIYGCSLYVWSQMYVCMNTHASLKTGGGCIYTCSLYVCLPVYVCMYVQKDMPDWDIGWGCIHGSSLYVCMDPCMYVCMDWHALTRSLHVHMNHGCVWVHTHTHTHAHTRTHTHGYQLAAGLRWYTYIHTHIHTHRYRCLPHGAGLSEEVRTRQRPPARVCVRWYTHIHIYILGYHCLPHGIHTYTYTYTWLTVACRMARAWAKRSELGSPPARATKEEIIKREPVGNSHSLVLYDSRNPVCMYVYIYISTHM
jgi:hypothetical protein